MASALTSPFHGLPVDEAVPAAADMTELKQASILQGRRRVRFQAQTGTTANPGSIVQFVLADSTGLLDVNSMVFSCGIQCSATGGPAVMDEGPSWCRRIQVLANGSLIEDIDNAHRAANLAILSSAEKDWYSHDGSFANYWKFNETLSAFNPTETDMNPAVAQNAVQAHFTQAGAEMAENIAVNANGSTQYAWPLGLIAPSLRSNKYWPLRSMGELVLQFTLANANEAVWSPAGTNPVYNLTDIFLEVDIVVPHPAYASLLDRMTQLESEPGLTIPIETRLVTQGQSIDAAGGLTSVNGAAGFGGAIGPVSVAESSIVVSRATTNLRRIIYAVQPTAALNTGLYPSVSCFPDEGCAGFQVRVGSLYFPSQPANSLARMFYMTSAAFGEPASTDKAAIFNRHNYDTTTAYAQVAGQAAGAAYRQLAQAGQFQGTFINETQAVGGGTPQYLRFPYSDFSPKAYCFDAYKNTSAPLANDGISVLGQAGSQIVVIARHGNLERITPTVVLDATKVIVLKDGGLRVMGA